MSKLASKLARKTRLMLQFSYCGHINQFWILTTVRRIFFLSSFLLQNILTIFLSWSLHFKQIFCFTDLDLSLNPSGEVTKQIGDALPVSCTISASRNATVVWMKVSKIFVNVTLLALTPFGLLLHFIWHLNMYTHV